MAENGTTPEPIKVLRVITQSRTDVQSVFDAIVTRVKRLLDAHTVVLMRLSLAFAPAASRCATVCRRPLRAASIKESSP